MKIKLFAALLVFFAVISCGKIKETVDKKIDEKVDETINDQLKKLDSTLTLDQIDSLKNRADSILKSINTDSLLKSLDSIENKTQKSKKK